jgi:hypothetical protein
MLKINYKEGTKNLIVWYYAEKSSNEDIRIYYEEGERHEPLFSERFTDFCKFQCLLLLDTCTMWNSLTPASLCQKDTESHSEFRSIKIKYFNENNIPMLPKSMSINIR